MPLAKQVSSDVRININTKKMINKIIFIVFILLIIIFTVKEGHVSQIHLSEVSLNTLIDESNCIIIARKTNPFITQSKIDPTPFWKKLFCLKKPFIETTYNFIVLDVLYFKGKISNDALIHVTSIDGGAALKMYNYPNKSPIVDSYKSNVDFEKSDELILFLNAETIPYATKNTKFSFTVADAYESVNKKKEIEKIIKDNNK